MDRLFGLLLEEGDQVVSVLGLLETAKGHLGTRNVLLGVLEVLELEQLLAIYSKTISFWLHVIPEYRCSTRCPFACWRRCMSNPQRNQSCGRKDRGAQGQSCYPRPPSRCGTERIVSSTC